MKKLLLLVLILLSGSSAQAQGLYHYIAPLTNQRGVPVTTAAVYMCTSGSVPNFTNTPPCTEVNIYNDIAGSSLITQPLSTGPLGNIEFYIAPGTYVIAINKGGVSTSSDTLTMPCTTTQGCTGSGSSPGSPTSSLQYNNSGAFGGSSLLFTPSSSCPAGAITCDDYSFTANNSCITDFEATDSLLTFGNSYSLCTTAGNVPSVGTILTGLTVSAESRSPAVGAFAFAGTAAARGSSQNAIGMFLEATDDPLDSTAGPTILAGQLGVSLTRATGTIPEATSLKITSPINTIGGGAPAAETATLLTGVHIQDQLAKGATTAGLYIDSQTSCATCYAIDVLGGPSKLQATTFGGLATLASTTVASLPSAASNPGGIMYVTDSTTVSSEGQTCVGSSTNKALAFSNGISWKCF